MQWAVAPPAAQQAAAVAAGGPAHLTPAPAAAPRVFSLQKVVEVADYNMHTRSRVTWARIWETLSSYFAAICCSPNTSIAMYAIDSLKQLSLKFLEKPELRSFHFQTKFLQVSGRAILRCLRPRSLSPAHSAAPSASCSPRRPSFLS